MCNSCIQKSEIEGSEQNISEATDNEDKAQEEPIPSNISKPILNEDKSAKNGVFISIEVIRELISEQLAKLKANGWSYGKLQIKLGLHKSLIFKLHKKQWFWLESPNDSVIFLEKLIKLNS
jgi:hypothetical protein